MFAVQEFITNFKKSKRKTRFFLLVNSCLIVTLLLTSNNGPFPVSTALKIQIVLFIYVFFCIQHISILALSSKAYLFSLSGLFTLKAVTYLLLLGKFSTPGSPFLNDGKLLPIYILFLLVDLLLVVKYLFQKNSWLTKLYAFIIYSSFIVLSSFFSIVLLAGPRFANIRLDTFDPSLGMRIQAWHWDFGGTVGIHCQFFEVQEFSPYFIKLKPLKRDVIFNDLQIKNACNTG